MATIFVFVMTNAWLSLVPIYGSITAGGVPLLRGANTDINLPLALALFSFVAVTYFGIKQLGFIKYSSEFIRVRQIKSGLGKLFKGNLKGALGEIMFGVIDLFSGVIELISQFIRIISFTFRLFGNMIAGEILLLVMTYLVGFGVPVVFYLLEVLVGFVQALIFGGLTLVFLTLAVAEHEEEENT